MNLKIVVCIALTSIMLTACKSPLDDIACEASKGILQTAEIAGDSQAIADAQKEVKKSCK